MQTFAMRAFPDDSTVYLAYASDLWTTASCLTVSHPLRFLGQSPPRRSPGGVFLVYRVDVGRLPKGRVWKARPTKFFGFPPRLSKLLGYGVFTVSFATNFPSGEASANWIESREPRAGRLLILFLDPFLIVRSAVL